MSAKKKKNADKRLAKKLARRQPPIEEQGVYTYEDHTVRKGDFGTRYRVLDGVDKAFNRSITVSHAERIADHWDANRAGVIVLLKMSGFYYIIDGQHRMWAASEIGNIKLYCQVYTIAPYGGDLKKWLKLFNIGRKTPSSGEHLEMARGESFWPDVFKGYELAPVYTSQRVTLAWTAIIRAHDIATRFAESKQLYEPGAYYLDNYLDLWHETPLDEMPATAEALVWWNKIAVHARQRRVRGFCNYRVMAMAIITYHIYKDEKVLLLIEDRLLNTYPRVKDLAKAAAEGFPSLLTAWLEGCNYRSPTNVIKLCGRVR